MMPHQLLTHKLLFVLKLALWVFLAQSRELCPVLVNIGATGPVRSFPKQEHSNKEVTSQKPTQKAQDPKPVLDL